MEETLNEEQAIAIIKQIVAQQSAFRMAEKMLGTIIEGRKFMADLDKQKTSVEADVKQLQLQLEKLNEQIRGTNTKLSRAKEEAEIAKGVINNEVDEIQRARDKARADFEAVKEKIEADRADLEVMSRKKAEEYSALNKAFNALKRDHGI